MAPNHDVSADSKRPIGCWLAPLVAISVCAARGGLVAVGLVVGRSAPTFEALPDYAVEVEPEPKQDDIQRVTQAWVRQALVGRNIEFNEEIVVASEDKTGWRVAGSIDSHDPHNSFRGTTYELEFHLDVDRRGYLLHFLFLQGYVLYIHPNLEGELQSRTEGKQRLTSIYIAPFRTLIAN